MGSTSLSSYCPTCLELSCACGVNGVDDPEHAERIRNLKKPFVWTGEIRKPVLGDWYVISSTRKTAYCVFVCKDYAAKINEIEKFGLAETEDIGWNPPTAMSCSKPQPIVRISNAVS